MAEISWVPCSLKKGSFYIIGGQTSGLFCSHLYINFTNLGLSHAKGSLLDQRLAILIEQHLQRFEITIKNDLVALVTDGSSVMKCVGK